MITAYKFLSAGGIGPFSRFAWPIGAPGPWVEADVDACVSGVHACGAEDLPFWIHAELWEIELEDVVRERRKLVASRGRLLRRIDGWDANARQDFSNACVDSLEAVEAVSPYAEEYRADLGRRADRGDAAMCGFIAARAAEAALGPAGYDAERSRQASWLVDRLELTTP